MLLIIACNNNIKTWHHQSGSLPRWTPRSLLPINTLTNNITHLSITTILSFMLWFICALEESSST